MTEPTVLYSVMSIADAADMARVMGEVFARRDPPAYAVGITPEEFEFFVELLAPKAAREGLTIVARAAAGENPGELLGAMITEDAAGEMPEGLERLSPKFDPIMDILGQLDAEYKATHSPQPGEAVHLFLLGVVEKAAGRGIAQQLVARALEHAAQRGYKLAITEATNKTSQHIFRKLGFVERVRRSYAEHRFRGTAHFTAIAEHGGPMLMDKALDS